MKKVINNYSEAHICMRTFVRIGIVVMFALPFIASAQAFPLSVSVDVPDHCTVIDTDAVSHTYASSQFLGICALQTAINAGSISGVQFSNAFPSMGLFVTTIGGAAADPNTEYWALYQNGSFASLGLSQLPVAAGDTITLELHDFSENFLGSRLTLSITSLVIPASALGAPLGGSSITLHDPFDIPQALEYIWSKQHSDGSFGSPLLNDWVAIASAGGGAGDMRARLSAYEMANHPTLLSVTDYERHAMALQALGINPYSGTSIDVIAPIVKAFDGTQVGDPSLVNDDIFALFPLMHAGYAASDDSIAKTTAFIIGKQHADGSWDGSVDMTAAAVQALSLVRSLPGTSDATSKALGYLRREQESEGGFGNVSATSWAMQAIAAVGQSGSDWNAGTYRTPDYYLATKQERDGGVLSESTDMGTRLWATAYAIPAVERKTWDLLLSSFPRPAVVEAQPAAVETTTATTSLTVAAVQAEPARTFEKPLGVAVEGPKGPVVKEEEAPTSPVTADVEAATTSVSVSPQFAQVASVATVGNEVFNVWKWSTIALSLVMAAGIALYFVRAYR